MPVAAVLKVLVVDDQNSVGRVGLPPQRVEQLFDDILIVRAEKLNAIEARNGLRHVGSILPNTIKCLLKIGTSKIRPGNRRPDGQRYKEQEPTHRPIAPSLTSGVLSPRERG